MRIIVLIGLKLSGFRKSKRISTGENLIGILVACAIQFSTSFHNCLEILQLQNK